MNLQEYYWLPRAGRFSSSFEPNARLPLTFGKKSTQSWNSQKADRSRIILPCIKVTTDSSNELRGIDFCYTLGMASYSSGGVPYPDIYCNGTYVREDFTFESNHYEGGDLHISYISFTSNLPNLTKGDIITAHGDGMSTSTAYSNSTYHTTTSKNLNAIDMLEHFVSKYTTISTSIFDLSAKIKARDIFNSSSYVLSGAITEDLKYWDLFQQMMGSFGGNVYSNGDGKLVLDIETNISTNSYSALIPKSEIEFVRASQKQSNLINRCPVSYDYSYRHGEFMLHTDETTDADQASINAFGTQEPATPLQLRWTNHQETANAIQDRVISRYKYPVWDIEIKDRTLKRANLDVGDIAVISLDELYQKDGRPFTNRACKVVEVSPDWANGSINFRMQDLGLNLTTSGSLTDSTVYDKTDY